MPDGDYLIRVTAPLDGFDYDALKRTVQELVSKGNPA